MMMIQQLFFFSFEHPLCEKSSIVAMTLTNVLDEFILEKYIECYKLKKADRMFVLLKLLLLLLLYCL